MNEERILLNKVILVLGGLYNKDFVDPNKGRLIQNLYDEIADYLKETEEDSHDADY